MGVITLRIIDGADRGRVFDTLVPPITIGREEGNSIQLNDERVSRYHVKIQEDHNRLVLTDLESTNGTKVNGEDVQLRILRYGDTVQIGRSVLLYGTRDQIAVRLARLREKSDKGTAVPEMMERLANDPDGDFDLQTDDIEMQATLHTLEPPELPERLSPGQRAQFAEILEFLHIRLRGVLTLGHQEHDDDKVAVELQQWQQLLDLQSRLAEYLRNIGNP